MYNPKNSNINETTMADFIRLPLTGDLTEVPGISQKQAKLLKMGGDVGDRITNTFQLIGKFLSFKTFNDETGEYISSQEHCDKFIDYLKHKGINSFVIGIVNAIAEKSNTAFPGIYDFADFE